MRYSIEERLRKDLKFVYPNRHDWVYQEILKRINSFATFFPEKQNTGNKELSHKDIVLITYGDQFSVEGIAPLKTLRNFLNDNLQGIINSVHILPFFPFSSDDGFSVIDYKQVDPRLGTWDDILSISKDYRLMFDAVINHISRESEWFQKFLQDEEPYRDYFITMSPNEDLSQVVRPRALPLLTPVNTSAGQKYVWTTFSDDQIDLNYKNPNVLLEIVDVLLHYIAHGASIIRLDAIAYLWKEVGTSCIHLPQTHAVVRIFRTILDAISPSVILITETNVPHEENISYFGNPLNNSMQTDEAQMVYQFPLAPLILHTFHTGDCTKLNGWINELNSPGIFFNFIASHDGIGMMPARGILSDAEIEELIQQALSNNGQVSYKTNPDGSKSVYELNITLFDMLNGATENVNSLHINRFIASQLIMLSLAGVPGIYVHSLFGSRNCTSCVEATGKPRSINREKFNYEILQKELQDENTIKFCVFEKIKRLLQTRIEHPAFHPTGTQKVLECGPSVFALARISPTKEEIIISVVNVNSEPASVRLDIEEYETNTNKCCVDLITDKEFIIEDHQVAIHMDPYQYLWLKI